MAATQAATLEQQQDALNAQLALQQARLEQVTARLLGQHGELEAAKHELKLKKEQVPLAGVALW